MKELQKVLDEWMDYYNNHRTHQGKMCCGQTPIETLEDGKSIWAEKNLCSGQLKLATVLEFSQYNRSDSLGVRPPLY